MKTFRRIRSRPSAFQRAIRSTQTASSASVTTHSTGATVRAAEVGAWLCIRVSGAAVVAMDPDDNRRWRFGDRLGANRRSSVRRSSLPPPRPAHRPEVLLDFVEACVAEISHDFRLADVILAGDLNQLSDNDVIERTGLSQIVHQPTRGTNILDRVFVSTPDLYGTVRIVTSVVRSDHNLSLIHI